MSAENVNYLTDPFLNPGIGTKETLLMQMRVYEQNDQVAGGTSSSQKNSETKAFTPLKPHDSTNGETEQPRIVIVNLGNSEQKGGQFATVSIPSAGVDQLLTDNEFVLFHAIATSGEPGIYTTDLASKTGMETLVIGNTVKVIADKLNPDGKSPVINKFKHGSGAETGKRGRGYQIHRGAQIVIK